MRPRRPPPPTPRASPDIDTRPTSAVSRYGDPGNWSPQKPRFRLLQLLLAWVITAVAMFVAAAVVPGDSVGTFADALVAALLIGALNAVLPPLVAALVFHSRWASGSC